MISISHEDQEWDKWYNPNDVDHEEDNEQLYQLLKKGCSGDLEGREHEQLKLLMLDQSVEDRTKAQYRARHSIYPSDEKESASIQFSKYHIDFGFREGEKCKVGVVLKDKIRMSNRGSSKVSYSFSNIPVHSSNIKLTFTPSSGTIKKNSAVDIQVEMVVLCTTKVRELVAIDIANSGRHLFSIKIDSKMSQVLDYKELEVGNVIGGGGYGAIYKSKWRGLSVAVKVISEMSDGSEFEKELEMHKELLHHPNIVHFVGFCVSPKCLVLEYVEGGSLDKYLSDSQYQFSYEQRLKMAYDIAKGMSFLHRSEILHLDLKPQNFLVVSLSLQAPVSIKLADFGLATSSTRSFYGATVEGSFLYMSPEVFTQKKFSRAADVWSYGACLIEILSGKRPYQEYDELGYLELARVREEGQSPAIPKEIDNELRKLIESCLHRDHTKRPSFDNIESFLEKKAEDIIKMSQTEGTSGGSGFFSSGGGSGFFSSNSSNIYSSSPQPTSPRVQQSPILLVSNNPNFGRKLPPIPAGGPAVPSKLSSSTDTVGPVKPVPPPRSNISRSHEHGTAETVVMNKAHRAMTDVSINETPRSETIPQRSVTISTPQSTPNFNHSFITKSSSTPSTPQTNPLLNRTTQQRPPTPALINRPSTPIPKSITPPKSNKPPPPNFSNNMYNRNMSNSNSDESLSSQSSDVQDYYEECDTSSTDSYSQPPVSTPPPTKTVPIPIKSKLASSSTPHIQTNLVHKPPIRASSAFEIKSDVTTTSSAPKHLPPHVPQHHHLADSSKLSTSDDSMDSTKYSELRMRSLRVLKDLYLSFTETIRGFSDIKSLKECIELGQRIRDFKKEIEVLCVEHLQLSWDVIHDHVKALNKQSEIKNLQSPHPGNFDGDTYNKVIAFRDAAVTVGESALDGLFYLMSRLSPPTTTSTTTTTKSPSSSSSSTTVLSTTDKENILKIAKITRAMKLNK